MTEHVHHCPSCSDDVLCKLDCDTMEDGENVCGPCAERAFDGIKVIPAPPRPRDTYALCDYRWDGWLPYGPYTHHEAMLRFPSDKDVKVRVVSGSFGEPLYPSGEEPIE